MVRPDLGRRAASRLLRSGGVTVNGQPRDARYFVKNGEIVEVRAVAVPPAGPPRVILRTDHLIAAGKPPGMPVNPTPDASECLLGWIGRETDPARPGIVHRLDRDTSGLVLFSMSPEGHRILEASFRTRGVRKLYIALVAGRIRPRRGIIDRPLARDRSGRVRIDRNGRPAQTEYFTMREGAHFTLIAAVPRSGRMHQIRVHLASIGHAIVADADYGDPRFTSGAPRMWLHAAALHFPAEIAGPLGSPERIECPLWGDLTTHLAQIGMPSSWDSTLISL